MLKKRLKQYITENKYDICMIGMLLVIGVLLGIGIYFIVNDNTTKDLINSITNIFDMSTQDKIIKLNVILNSFKTNIILVVLLLFFSITLLGRYFIYITTLLKGISIGIYSCILFSIFNIWWGLLVIVLLVLLVNLVYIPAYIYVCTTLLAFHFELFNTKKESTSVYTVTKTLTKLVCSFAFIFSSSILEQILTNVVLKIYEKI